MIKDIDALKKNYGTDKRINRQNARRHLYVNTISEKTRNIPSESKKKIVSMQHSKEKIQLVVC